MRPVAAAGPDRRRAPQPRPRRSRRVRLFEIGRRYLADSEHPTVAAAARRREAAARLAGGQGAAASTPSTPRPRRWRCSRRPARRSPICSCSPTPGRPGTRAARRRCGSGRRRCSRRSASCTRGWRSELDAPARRGRRRNLSRRDPGAALERPRAAGLHAAGAAAGDPRLRLPRAGRPRRRQRWSGRSAAPTRRRSPRPACSTASRPRTACRWRSRSRSSRPTRASPTRRSRRSRSGSSPPPRS